MKKPARANRGGFEVVGRDLLDQGDQDLRDAICQRDNGAGDGNLPKAIFLDEHL